MPFRKATLFLLTADAIAAAKIMRRLMDKSRVSLRRTFVILGLFVTTTVLFLAPRASAGSFTSTLA
jgi:voltage-gated potassium channel Kch